jgi:hypothetical protein
VYGVQPAFHQRCRSSISLPTATAGHTVLSSAQIRQAAITATTILLQPAYQDSFIGMTHQVQVVLPSGRLTARIVVARIPPQTPVQRQGSLCFRAQLHYRRRGHM